MQSCVLRGGTSCLRPKSKNCDFLVVNCVLLKLTNRSRNSWGGYKLIEVQCNREKVWKNCQESYIVYDLRRTSSKLGCNFIMTLERYEDDPNMTHFALLSQWSLVVDSFMSVLYQKITILSFCLDADPEAFCIIVFARTSGPKDLFHFSLSGSRFTSMRFFCAADIYIQK